MYKIVKKRDLNPTVCLMEIEAPAVAKKAKAGQFIIFRIDELGERVPLTVADYDREKGTVTIIFQKVGRTTMRLGDLNQGDSILDFVGPLGKASEFDGMTKVCVVGGGVGCAIAYPQAKALHDAGIEVEVIAGFRSKDIVILEDEMKASSDKLFLCTDDGTYGQQGFVTDVLKKRIEEGANYSHIITIGPLIMMKFVVEVAKAHNIPAIVSMNPVMVDGTGMCGCCRVTVGGEVKFACVDGPDFDGYEVDFDETMRRSKMFAADEKKQLTDYMCERDENCNLMSKEVEE
ncbi:MAG: sulfide/dihydroorotate dehydrogenase-like FAD/NAD-binding protein [Clostridia bacterium]|nr:sulfide/dihydroorotate dehydrogenase-like FAD/NAD-binding protein [Clostridia bacterium]